MNHSWVHVIPNAAKRSEESQMLVLQAKLRNRKHIMTMAQHFRFLAALGMTELRWSDHSCNPILPTPVSPAGERLEIFRRCAFENDRSWRLRSEYVMWVATLTTWNENGCGREAGNHKGCPYDGFVGVYFRRNDRFRSKARVCIRGIHSCSLVCCTASNESGNFVRCR